MSYSRSFAVLTGFFIFASVTGGRVEAHPFSSAVATPSNETGISYEVYPPSSAVETPSNETDGSVEAHPTSSAEETISNDIRRWFEDRHSSVVEVPPNEIGDDCYLCPSDDEYKRWMSSVDSSLNKDLIVDAPTYHRRIYIIIPVGAFAVLCKWWIYTCCRRKRRGVPYTNMQQETTAVTAETSVTTDDGNLQNLSVVTLPNAAQSTLVPAPAPGFSYPGCISLTQPTDADQPPSYSEACSEQPPNKQFHKQ